MSSSSVHGTVDRATDSDAFEYLARAGFAISGVLHLIVAFIVMRIAFGSGGNADQSGALATLAKQPGGTLMLWTAAVGMAALALWHVAEAIVGQARRAVAEPAGPRRPTGVEAGERHRRRHPVFRHRTLGGALRHGQRPVERSAERRHVRAADAIRLGQGSVDRGRDSASPPSAPTTCTRAHRRSS